MSITVVATGFGEAARPARRAASDEQPRRPEARRERPPERAPRPSSAASSGGDFDIPSFVHQPEDQKGW